MIQPTFINLHPNECTQGLRYYPFADNLDRCVGSCNTVNDHSNRVCVPKKREDMNIHVCNMITRVNESNILAKYISWKCECNIDGRIY